MVADRRLPLLHRLEHGRLRLGAASVDLVEQHEVGVDRPELRLEGSVLLVVHRVPTMSLGSRSGVHWMRWKVPPTA